MSFGADENNDVTAAVPDAAGVDWVTDGAVYRLTSVRWQRISRPTLPHGCTPTRC